VSISQRDGAAGKKRRPIALFIALLFFALLNFFRAMESPHFESYRTMDVIQLVLSGACFGATVTGLAFLLVRRRR